MNSATRNVDRVAHETYLISTTSVHLRCWERKTYLCFPSRLVGDSFMFLFVAPTGDIFSATQ